MRSSENDKINVIYTYYDNPELLSSVVEYYSAPSWSASGFVFTVIDDGSQKYPITRYMVPQDWNLLRVEEDHGWGNEMARNIAMRHTAYEWNILIDLDYLIEFSSSALSLITATRLYHDLRGELYCYQFERGTRTEYDDHTKVLDIPGGINSFLISKTAWMQTYGYDEAFGYTYGNDESLFAQLKREVIMYDTALDKIALQATAREFKPQDRAEFAEWEALAEEFEASGHYNRKYRQWKLTGPSIAYRQQMIQRNLPSTTVMKTL